MKRTKLVNLDTLRERERERERELYFSKKRYNFKEYKISKDSDKSLIN